VNPVDKLAALQALSQGVTAAIVTAKAEVAAYRVTTRAKAFASDWGDVTFVGNPAKICYGDPMLLVEWALEHMPHEVVAEHTVTVPASVRPTLMKTLEDRWAISGDAVVDTQSGEVIPFARVEAAGPDTVRFTMTRQLKAAAEALIAGRVDALAAAVQGEISA
jgi:hypothetical protein